MPNGRLITRQQRPEEQFVAVDDLKLRLKLVEMSDRYSDRIRILIYRTYQDDELAMIYRSIRNSGIYDKGSKSKAQRKIIEFPNGYVDDFVSTVMTEKYGPDWLSNRKALHEDLVRPWWVVSKI